LFLHCTGALLVCRQSLPADMRLIGELSADLNLFYDFNKLRLIVLVRYTVECLSSKQGSYRNFEDLIAFHF
jgi:hypothetical protein